MMFTMMRRVNDWWNRRYPDWVPEIALRYLPVVESIRAESPRGLILEVGVNRSGLTTYLHRPVVGVDCVMEGTRPAFVTPILAKGQALPFQAGSFDVTVCMDTLEHIEFSDRNRFLREIMRVTRRRVYIGCPMGFQAEQEDQALRQYYQEQRGGSFPFLDEHVANGLPRLKAVLAEMEGIAEDSERPVRFHCEPNLNVWVHRVLLRLWMRTDRVSYVLHRLAIVLVHVRRWLNVGPCYRQIIVAEFDSSNESL
jgi:SAM-dependent methyltransferase